MPDKATLAAARKDKREGMSASTQAGEFVHEEIKHIREGKHGARSAKQAIAIGLSKARRAGVKLPAPKKGTTSESTRVHAERDLARGQRTSSKAPSAKRSRAVLNKLKKESHQVVSTAALSKQARSSARRRTASQRSASAKKAARTRAANES